MLMVGSTLFTIPTSPSGATTGLNGTIPAFAPAERVTVYSSPTPRPCSTSAGTNPHFSASPRPRSLRRRLLSARVASSAMARSAMLARQPGAAALLGVALQRDEGREDRLAKEGRERIADAIRELDRREGEHHARDEEDRVPAAVRTSGGGHALVRSAGPTSTCPRRPECAPFLVRRR